jgi:hypothetical protein
MVSCAAVLLINGNIQSTVMNAVMSGRSRENLETVKQSARMLKRAAFVFALFGIAMIVCLVAAIYTAG